MPDPSSPAASLATPSPAAAPAPATPHPVELHQPFVHDLIGVFGAPVQAWSRSDGSMSGHGAQGIYLGDTRIVSTLRVEAEGAELSPLGTQIRSAREIDLTDAVSLADGYVDPLLVLTRTRRAEGTGIRERIVLTSADARPRALRLRIVLGLDDSSMSAVKDPRVLARRTDPLPTATVDPDGTAARWAFGPRTSATISASAPLAAGERPHEVVLALELALDGPGSAEASWSVTGEDPSIPFAAPAPSPGLARAIDAARERTRSTDPEERAVADLLALSLGDLDALRLAVPGRDGEVFFAAGAPWYFTMFGRDALISASLALPVDRETAWGTLRALGALQGVAVDPETAEQPGKILHEVRAQGMDMVDSYLPPVYYGTIDATPLWIELLHETWTAERAEDPSRADARARDLLPRLEAAATWLLEHADADGDGFLEYINESGHGLANQGWKDSGDSIRFADGSLASGTIALAEVQGYAYAAMLDELGSGAGGASRDGETSQHAALSGRLRDGAAALRERFRAQFWCADARGRYVALALDGAKARVDGVASNMGHLLGTGLLDADEEAAVVARLVDPTMSSGYGIRTLSTDNGAYWPLRYHGGSVWTHDTGFIIRGMLRAGFAEEAAGLARDLLRAADGFDLRLPELFSGQGADEVRPPLPYPASCRPQAWAAASAVPVAQALGRL
ncbi:glycogen debranching N-terminal domain-containing protein [Brachybacterium huguangmaarense]